MYPREKTEEEEWRERKRGTTNNVRLFDKAATYTPTDTLNSSGLILFSVISQECIRKSQSLNPSNDTSLRVSLCVHLSITSTCLKQRLIQNLLLTQEGWAQPCFWRLEHNLWLFSLLIAQTNYNFATALSLTCWFTVKACLFLLTESLEGFRESKLAS